MIEIEVDVWMQTSHEGLFVSLEFYPSLNMPHSADGNTWMLCRCPVDFFLEVF